MKFGNFFLATETQSRSQYPLCMHTEKLDIEGTLFHPIPIELGLHLINLVKYIHIPYTVPSMTTSFFFYLHHNQE